MRKITFFISAIILCLFLSSSLFAYTDTWVQITMTDTPTTLRGHAAVWDSYNKRMLVYGGESSPGWARNLLWSYNGTSWTELNTDSGMLGRANHTMVFDPVYNRMLVYGGASDPTDDTPTISDMWSYTSSGTWWQLFPGGPSWGDRTRHCATWDPQNSRMLVFGGRRGDSLTYQYQNDLWSYYGAGNGTCSQLFPSGTAPCTREFASAVWDPQNNRMLLVGGYNPQFGELNDIWSFSGAGDGTWTQLFPGGGAFTARKDHTAVWDSVNNRMIVFGGIVVGGSSSNDVWSFYGSGNGTWQQLTVSGNPPAVRSAHSAIYNPESNRMVVYGGREVFLNDLWEIRNSTIHDTAIFIVNGNNQTRTVGQVLPTPLKVFVRGAGQGYPNYNVTFSVDTGGSGNGDAKLFPDNNNGTQKEVIATDANGYAEVTLLLDTYYYKYGPQLNRVVANIYSGLSSAVTFDITAKPDKASAEIILISGNNQTGTINTTLADTFLVRVRDRYDNNIDGETVTLTPMPGGYFDNNYVSYPTTGGSGTRNAYFTFDNNIGPHQIVATIAIGITRAVTFDATANPSPVDKIQIMNGDEQTGPINTMLYDQLVVKVMDVFNNGKQGVTVTFTNTTAGGSFSSPVTTTDSNGVARTWFTFDGTIGDHNVSAWINTGTTQQVEFKFYADPVPADKIVIVSGNNQTKTVNYMLTSPLTIRVSDASNNPISNILVIFEKMLGGGSFPGGGDDDAGFTDTSGNAQLFFTFDTYWGPHKVRARIGSGNTRFVTFDLNAVPGPVSDISIVSGSGQSGQVGTTMPSPLVVSVKDIYNVGLSGSFVSFIIVAGTGSLSQWNSYTDSSGKTQTNFICDTVTGQSKVRAIISSGLTWAVTFDLWKNPGPINSIYIVSGNNQTQTVNTFLVSSLVVKAIDMYGNAKSGQQVSFNIVLGGGVLSNSSVFTTGSGQASVTFTFDSVAGLRKVKATVSNGVTREVTFDENAVPGPMDKVEIIAGTYQIGLVNTMMTIPFTVKVTDSFNNPISGVQVSYAITLNGGTLGTPNPAVTTSSGTTSIRYTFDSVAGYHTIRASISDGVTKQVTFDVTADPAGIDKIQIISGNNQTTTVNLRLPGMLVVRVTDASNNPLSNVIVFFGNIQGDDIYDTNNDKNNTIWTDTNGNAPVFYEFDTNKGPRKISAYILNGNTKVVTFDANAIPDKLNNLFLVSGNSQTKTVNTMLPNPLVVKTRDAYSNGISSVPVTFTLTLGGGTLSAPVVLSDSDGFARVYLTFDTAKGSRLVEAKVTLADGSTKYVNFSENANSDMMDKLEIVEGNNQTRTVNYTLVSWLKVRVSDQFNNVIDNKYVNFSIVMGGGTLNNSSVPTDMFGFASVLYTFDSITGIHKIKASIDAGTTKIVTFDENAIPGPIDKIEIVIGTYQAGVVNQMMTTPFVVKVTDIYNNGLSNVLVTYAITSGPGGTFSSPNPALTTASGTVAVRFTFDGNSGLRTVMASMAYGNTKNVTFDIIGEPTGVDKIEIISGNNQTRTVNYSVPTLLRVKVTDSSNNPLSNVLVDFYRSTGTNDYFEVPGDDGEYPKTTFTDNNGYSQVWYTYDSSAGPRKITVTILNGTTKIVTFDLNAIPDIMNKIQLVSGFNQTRTVGLILPSPLVSRVQDAYNNNISGALVSFSLTVGGGTLSANNVATDSAGNAQVIYTFDNVSGLHKIKASIPSGNTREVTFDETATPGPINKVEIILGNNQTRTVNYQLLNSLIAGVRDQYDNPISGVTLTFTIVQGGGILSSPVGTTFPTGNRAVWYTLDTVPGAKKVRAEISAGVTKQVTFDVTGVTPGIDRVEIVSGNNQTRTVSLMFVSPLLVKVADVYNNGLSGVNVSFSFDTGTGVLSAINVLSNSSGNAQVFCTSDTISGVRKVRAEITSGVTKNVTFDLNANPDAINKIIIVNGNNQTTTVNYRLPNFIMAGVRDQFNNPISGVTITFTIVQGGGILSANAVVTSGSGNKLVYYTFDSIPGLHKVRAEISFGVTRQVTFDENAVPGPIDKIEIVAGNYQAGLTNQMLATPLIVKVSDIYNNGLSDILVTYAITSGGGGTFSAPNPVATNSSGTTAVRFTFDGTAGGREITASMADGNTKNVTFDVTADPAGVDNIEIISGNNQTVTVNYRVPTLLKVRVADSGNNPLSGAIVQFYNSTGTQDYFRDWGDYQTVDWTDSDGFSEMWYTFDGSAGPRKMTVTIVSGTTKIVTFDANAIPDVMSKIQLVSGYNQTGTVGQVLPNPLVCKVTDAFNNNISGALVSFSFTVGGGVLSANNVVTNPAGQAQAFYTFDNVSGLHQIKASISSGNTREVTFDETAAPGSINKIIIVSGNNQTATVNYPLPGFLMAGVRDQYDNPISGVTITFTIVQGGGILNSNVVVTSATGNKLVYYTFDSIAGQHLVRAEIGQGTTKQVTFDEMADPDVMDKILISSGNNQTSTVNQTLFNPIEVLVTDAFNNPVAGALVSFTIVSGGGTLSSNSGITAVFGKTSVNYTFDSVSGLHKVKAYISSGTTKEITFDMTANPGPLNVISILSGNNQTGSIGQALQNPLWIKVKDAYSNNISGVNVSFAMVLGGGVISASNVLTNPIGEAQIIYTFDNVLGIHKVKASIPAGTTKEVTFDMIANPGPMDKIEILNGNNQSRTIGAGLPTPLDVKVSDQYGNPITGIGVSFVITLGGGTLSASTVLTDSAGSAKTYYTFDNVAGLHKVRASIPNGTTRLVTFDLTATPALGNLSIISGNNQTGVVGQKLPSPLIVRVSDQFGNNISGKIVTFSTVQGIVSPVSVLTNDSGQCQTWFTFDTLAGSHRVSVWIANAGVTGVVTFDQIANPAGIDKIEIVNGNNQTRTIGLALPTPLIIRVTDAYSNPISGVGVSFAITLGGGIISATNMITNAGGTAMVIYTLDTVTGAHAVRSSIATGTTKQVTFDITGITTGVDRVEIVSGNGQSGTINLMFISPLVVKVSDMYNNGLSGVNVSFTLAVGGGTLSAANMLTGITGLAQAYCTSDSTVGTRRVRATIAVGVTKQVTFDLYANPAILDRISIVSGNNQTRTVNRILVSPMIVKVSDAFNNGFSGIVVSFTLATGTGTFTASSVMTDSAGQAIVNLTLDSIPGLRQVRAEIQSGTTRQVTFDATGVSPGLDKIEVVSGGGQSGTIGIAFASPLLVKVSDVYNNAISGVTITFTLVTGAGTLSDTVVLSNVSGNAQTNCTPDTSVGTRRVRATMGIGTTKQVTFDLYANPQAIDKIVIVSGSNQTRTVNFILTSPLIVKVTDSYNNAFSGVTISFEMALGGGTLGAGSAQTDSSGQASMSFTLDSVAGAHKIKATIGSGVTREVSFDVNAIPGNIDNIAITSGNNQTGTAGRMLLSPLVVLVTDAYSNPISGISVSFVITTGGGTVSSATAVTNSLGLTSSSYTFDNVVGLHQVRASVPVGATRLVTFDLTAIPADIDKIAIVSGNNQTRTVGLALISSLIVKVTDVYNNAISGLNVLFEITVGGGTLSNSTIATDSAGQAVVFYTLDTVSGNHKVKASIPAGVTREVTFDLNANPGVLDQIVIVSGNNQAGTASQMLASPLTVKTADQYGNSVSAVNVSFAVTLGAGTLSASSAISDSTGSAKAYYTFDATGGLRKVKASISSGSIKDVTFDLSTWAGGYVELVSGNNQTGTVNNALSNPMIVKVRDQSGNGISGATVYFGSSAGTLSATSVTIADTTGLAQAWFTFDNTLGAHQVTAWCLTVGQTKVVTFDMTANLGGMDKIEIVAGNNQTGTTEAILPLALQVKVTDAYGNALNGITVAFEITTGAGTLSASSVLTDANGLASVYYTFDNVAGTHSVKASITSGTVKEVTFNMTAISGAPVITDVTPKKGYPGSKITITGTGFGENQGSSKVVFGDKTIESIDSWTETKIVCRIPEDASAQDGDLYVEVNGNKSNSISFSVKKNGFMFTAKKATQKEITLNDGSKVMVKVSDKTFEQDVVIEALSVIDGHGLYEKAKTADKAGATKIKALDDNPAVEFLAYAEDGSTLLGASDFKDKANITIYYTNISPYLENKLKIFWLDESANQWVEQSASAVNTSDNAVSVDVEHFSVYRVMASASDKLDSVVVYPNPWKKGTAVEDKIKFLNLTNDCVLQIYDITGNLVYEETFTNTGGAGFWNLKNSSGASVASGYYIYLIKTKDGTQKAVGKILILK